jgi:hypothetical protein
MSKIFCKIILQLQKVLIFEWKQQEKLWTNRQKSEYLVGKELVIHITQKEGKIKGDWWL